MTVSLRFVLSIGIALVAFLSALIAFAPIYVSGVSGIRGSLTDLRRAYIGRTMQQTQSFFAAPAGIVSTAMEMTKSDVLDWDITVPQTKRRWYSFIYDLVTERSDVVLMAMVLRPLVPNPSSWHESFFIYIDARWIPLGYPILVMEPNVTTSYDQLDSGVALMWPIVNGSVVYTPYPGQSTVPLSEDSTSSDQFHAMKAFPSMTLRWLPIRAGWDKPQIAVAGVMRDRFGNFVGGLRIDVDSNQIGAFLNKLGLRARGRAACVDSGTGVVIGMSWGESLVKLLPLFADTSKPDYLRMSFKTLNNISDRLMKEAATVVGVPRLLNGTAPYSTEVDTFLGPTYVDVVELIQPGLNVRILLVMPEVDFLDQIQSTQSKTIGGVAAAIFAVILGAFLLGHIMAAPFLRLRDRMYMTATLQDDGTTDPPSLLTEVHEMQTSYSLMKDELGKMKSYLPQSVLVALRGGNGANEEDEEEEGELAASKLEDSQLRVEDATQSDANRSRRSSSYHAGAPDSPLHRANETAVPMESDRQSTRSSARRTGAVAAVPRTLNTNSNVSSKRVTVALINLRGFHRYCGHATATDVTTHHAQLMEKISRSISDNKGVVDFFQGDHVQASFNAVSHCSGHAKRGAAVALEFVKELSQNANSLHASVGLSSGQALVGNMGSLEMKRFCIIGPVVPQAALLERMTRFFPGVSILCSSAMFPELGLEHYLQSVAVVRLPGAGGKPKPIASIEGLKKMATDEWMYQLQAGAASDPFASLNHFFDAASEGDSAQALRHFAEWSGVARDKVFAGEAEAQRISEHFRTNPAAPDTVNLDAVCCQLGAYYSTCLISEV